MTALKAAQVTQPAIQNVYETMSTMLDVDLTSESDAVHVVRSGISTKSYKRAAKRLQLDADLVAPETTIRRRLKTGTRFNVVESERLVRFIRVYAEAVQLFGTPKGALEWLNTPSDYLPGEPPISPMRLAATESGARLIESIIRRTAHGIF